MYASVAFRVGMRRSGAASGTGFQSDRLLSTVSALALGAIMVASGSRSALAQTTCITSVDGVTSPTSQILAFPHTHTVGSDNSGAIAGFLNSSACGQNATAWGENSTATGANASAGVPNK